VPFNDPLLIVHKKIKCRNSLMVAEYAGYIVGQDTQQEYCYHCCSTTLSVTHLAMLSVPASYSTDVISISSNGGIIITGHSW
jgi:hypothetical protein